MRPCAVARRLLLALALLCLAGRAPLSGADTSGRIEAAPQASLQLRGVELVTSKADANVATPLAFAFDYLVPEKDKERGLTFGAVVERRDENDAWVEIPPEDLAIEMQRFPPRGETERSGTRMVVTPRTGLPAGSYRVHVSALLPTESEAAAINKTFAWQVIPREAAAKSGGDVPPVIFEETSRVRFESWEAASDTVGGRFPGGQNLGFHGAWTDPVTGLVYLRNRWYDPRNGQFLSPDPRGPVDSPNLYAFVGQQPNMGTDPMGTCVGSLQRSRFCQGIAEVLRSFGQGTPAAESEANEREFYLQQKLAFTQANGRRPDADEIIFREGGGARLLYGSGRWVDASGRIEADHAEWAAIGVGMAGHTAFAATRAAGGTVLRATSSAAVAVADETAGNMTGVNPSTVRGLAGRWTKSVTPWQRSVYQRSDIDWDLVRPKGASAEGLTNWQAARKGYAPGRLNPDSGRWEDVILHHANQDPRGAAVEVWRSTHGRVPHQMDPPGPWRKQRPDWARAWQNEQSAYWRWRTGAYNPSPTPRLTLPGDQP